MTIQERMNTINGDGIHDYTFQEAVNKRLKTMGTHDSVDYSSISLHRYTAKEALNIIYKEREQNFTLVEILNKLAGNSDIHQETPQEALNSIETLTRFNAGIPS